MLRLKHLVKVLRIGLALLFLISGILKLTDLTAFAATIGKFGLLPDRLVPASALLLSVAELLGAGLLLLQKRSGLWLITGLLLTFMGALAYGIQLGLDIDCGCFGSLGSKAPTSLTGSLLRDIPLLLICVALFRSHRKTQPSNANSKKRS